MLTSHEAKSADDVAHITIYGEATDDAQIFTEDALITDRPFTNATLLWEVAEEWDIWAPYRTPDLSDKNLRTQRGKCLRQIRSLSGEGNRWVGGVGLLLWRAIPQWDFGGDE